MANSKGGTLVANAAAIQITIDDTRPNGLYIVNLTPELGVIWYRLDGVDPVPLADDSFVVIGARYIPNPFTDNAAEKVKVRLFSEAACKYMVEGNPKWVKA